MAHKYYCTHCARELDQDLVLLDMEPALTVIGEEKGSSAKVADQKFQLLKFRLSVAQFDALIARGVKGDLDYLHFDLSIEELASYLANEHNLNDPAIGALTLKDMDDYLADRRKSEFGAEDTSGDAAIDFSNDLSMDDLFGGPAEETEKAEEEVYQPSEAILALKGKIATAKGDNLTERLLEEDLSLLRKLVGENGCIPVAIKARYEQADTGDDILIGYYARRNDTQIIEDTRLCRYCDTHVFEHAGAAEHRAVTFIGAPSSGKTSTILALTHYAQRAARRVDAEDKIWNRSTNVPGIEFMEVVGMEQDLYEDLDLYDIGVAPKKTEAQEREDAYSATLWITNTRGDKFILTLIDLPGELFREDGSIDQNRILDEFPVAMSSDVFILCFDTTNVQGANAGLVNTRTCKWANNIQILRREYKEAATIRKPGEASVKLPKEFVAPMMIVFTKCADVESDAVEVQADRHRHNPRRVDEVYSLKVEREFIDRNPVYRDVGNMIRRYGDMQYAYIARLRTSPFGFAAPNKPDYLEDNSVNKNPDGSIKHPRPKQVDKLMQWLMTITGCVSAPAEFYPNAMDTKRFYKPENIYVKGAQYQIAPPPGTKCTEQRVKEAMGRAYLFENYSHADQKFIENYDNPSYRYVEDRITDKPGKNTNGGEKHGIFGFFEKIVGNLRDGEENT